MITLEPVMFNAGEQGIMKNPDIASFLTKDFYLSPLSYENTSDPAETYDVMKGQRIDAGDAAIRFVEFQMKGDHNAMARTPDGGVTVGAVLAIDRQSAHETLIPTAVVRPGKAPDYSREHSALLGADIQLAGMNIGTAETSEIRLLVERTEQTSSTGALVVEASVKPFIILLWFGTVAMVFGFGVAFVHRTKEGRS
jgi:cytochrome c-type biogenesis protein CcmF